MTLLREVNGVQDASALQRDLETVYQWAIDNNASFDNKKFEVLRHGNDETLKLSTNYTAPDGTIITEKSNLRDLGVTMSADGTFKQHITNVCQSARNMCSWILRTFESRSPELYADYLEFGGYSKVGLLLSTIESIKSWRYSEN